jgi:ELWxxDGT repeat protein
MKCLLPSLLFAGVLISGIAKSQNTAYSSLDKITTANGFFYFVLNDDVHGVELWRSDGSTQGTMLVRDINPGIQSSSPSHFMLRDSILFFIANDGMHGDALWRSDGTSEGTFLLKDISPLFFLSVDDRMLWHADRETTYTESSIAASSSSDNQVYFSGYDGQTGTELWKTDGSTEGTVLVKDITPGARSSVPRNFSTFGDKVVFSVFGNESIELWITDGSSEGTKKVFPDASNSSSVSLTKSY